MITVGQHKVKEDRIKKKNMNREVMEGLILSKLYKDGFFVVDEETKKVLVDARKNHIEDLYGADSYEDVIGIINKTAKGLALNGYEYSLYTRE